MEQSQILGYLGGLFQKNAPITDEVFAALKECLKPRNLEDYPEVEHDERTEEECLTSALMLLAQSAEEASEDEDEEGDE